MATVIDRSPFAIALDSFISDLKRKEDKKSPFYKEVLSRSSTIQDETSNLAVSEKASSSEAHAQQLQTFIRDLEARQRKSKRTLWLSEKLQPLVNGLLQYSAACDVMIQAAPDAAQLLFGAAKLVLMLAHGFQSCFDTVVAIMEEVGHLLTCYELFTRAYQDHGPEFKALLVETYKNIVSFWQKASQLMSRKTYKTLLSNLVKPLAAEWNECREGLIRDRDRVQMMAQATEADLQRQRDIQTQKQREASLKKCIVEWIKAGVDDARLDMRGDVRANNELRHKRTCNWVMEDSQMKPWLDANKTAKMWYSAAPGTGKTILSSALVRLLQDKGFKTAVYFFSFNDPVRRKPITLLRSLALQLLVHYESIPDQVKRLYEEDVTNHCFSLCDHRTALDLIAALLTRIGRVHIIIDGLDECENSTSLLHSLLPLLDLKRLGIVKWFFSSRPELVIRRHMLYHDVTEVVAPKVPIMEDIRAYVAHSYREAQEKDCAGCIDQWTRESDGNFLWITLMMRIVAGEGVTCEEDVIEELRKFPKNLTGFYIRSLTQLAERPEKFQTLARRIFAMIVGAVQPLRLSEISHALAAASSSTTRPAPGSFADDFNPKRVPKPELIEELCSNLIIFDRRDNGTEDDPMLKIAHKSIQDFFLQDPTSLAVNSDVQQFFVSRSDASLELGKACLHYLQYNRYHEVQNVTGLLEDPAHAFLKHAATFWYRYLDNAPTSKALADQVCAFVQSSAFWTCVNVQSKVAPHLFARYSQVSDISHKPQANGHIEEGEEEKQDYALPLPYWLDDFEPDGPRVVQHMLSFVKSWYPILNFHSDFIDQCVMSDQWMQSMPARMPWVSDSVRVEVSSRSNELAVTNHSSPEYVPVPKGRHWQLLSQAERQINGSTPGKAATACHWVATETKGDADSDFRDSAIGSITSHSDTASDDESESEDSGRESEAGDNEVENDSDDGSDEEDDSDDEDSELEEDTQDDNDDNKLCVRHCMYIQQTGEAPISSFWQAKPNSVEAVSAIHPAQPFAVWSHTQHELLMANLESSQIDSIILPEPVDVVIKTDSIVRKEFHFSDDGEDLHYLLYVVEENDEGDNIKQTLSFSSFSFTYPEDGSTPLLQRSHPTSTISYECDGPAFKPLILTDWGSQLAAEKRHLLVALPTLSCDARIVRIRLPYGEYNQSDGFKTLTSPIFFPSLTPYSAPRLTQQKDAKSKGTSLTLRLGPQGARDLSAPIGEDGTVPSEAVLTWQISKSKGWRVWNPKTDDQTAAAREKSQTCVTLRGSFVDAERSYGVSVRSGLDWRKKAFLACS